MSPTSFVDFSLSFCLSCIFPFSKKYFFCVCLLVFAYIQVCFFRNLVVVLVWCGVVFDFVLYCIVLYCFVSGVVCCFFVVVIYYNVYDFVYCVVRCFCIYCVVIFFEIFLFM